MSESNFHSQPTKRGFIYFDPDTLSNKMWMGKSAIAQLLLDLAGALMMKIVACVAVPVRGSVTGIFSMTMT
jgi:hypothetical protein